MILPDFTPLRLVPKSCVPDRFALPRSALTRMAPLRFALLRFAFRIFELEKLVRLAGIVFVLGKLTSNSQLTLTSVGNILESNISSL